MEPSYVERQWAPWWALALLGALVVVGCAMLVFAPSDTRSVGLSLTVVGALLLILIGPMDTQVDPVAVTASFGLLRVYRKHISLEEIAAATPCIYRPLAEYGGWGIRGSKRDRALTARGNMGVRLMLGDGSQVLIGSGDPHALADAIILAKGLRLA